MHNFSSSISASRAVADLQNTQSIFFASYVSGSMNPTLREPEVMEIMPYNNRRICVGDVIFFLPPEADLHVVHRITRITPACIFTRGDNNTKEDPYFLQQKDIKGQVVAALRGKKRRNIAGGWQGRLISRWLHLRRFFDRGVSPLLHPIYNTLSHWGLIAWMLPNLFRPRVIVFRRQGRDHFQLVLGQRIIGRYDGCRQQWVIQRPFKLFVNESILPGQQHKEVMN